METVFPVGSALRLYEDYQLIIIESAENWQSRDELCENTKRWQRDNWQLKQRIGLRIRNWQLSVDSELTRVLHGRL
jgi:hypothetical protein